MKRLVPCMPLVLMATLAGAEPKGYVQAGVLATAQPAGTPNHRISPAISGRAAGVAAAVGFFVAPKLAIEGEVLANWPVSTRQRFSYNWFEDFTGESRDVFVGVNGRFRPVRLLELVGGGGVAFSTVAERSIIRTDLPFSGRPNVPVAEADRVDSEVQLAVDGGVAVPVSITAKVAIVPAFTIRWIGRPSSGQNDYLGVSKYACQFGATVRFTLD
jgi:hypothetical protein